MKRRFSKGFSLTEVAIAIFIMVMGVVWVYSAINDMIRVSNNAVSRLEAGFLATEGMEFIKNKRDANFIDYLNNKGTEDCVSPDTNKGRCWWGYGFLDPALSNSTFYSNLDVKNGSIPGNSFFVPATNLPSGCTPESLLGDVSFRGCAEQIYAEDQNFPRLKIDEAGVYNYANGTTTIYKRIVVVSPMVNFFGDDFTAKYTFKSGDSEGSPTCGVDSAAAAGGAGNIQTNVQDRLRMDSIVIWNNAGKVEFIHLVTYLFNWHGLL